MSNQFDLPRNKQEYLTLFTRFNEDCFRDMQPQQVDEIVQTLQRFRTHINEKFPGADKVKATLVKKAAELHATKVINLAGMANQTIEEALDQNMLPNVQDTRTKRDPQQEREEAAARKSGFNR